MWTAAGLAALLTALGFVLKGALAKLAMLAGTWLLKKTFAVWFWTTPFGRRLWRGIRYRAYRAANPFVRRKLFQGYRLAVVAALAAHTHIERLRPW
jgi:hypothetical protein